MNVNSKWANFQVYVAGFTILRGYIFIILANQQ